MREGALLRELLTMLSEKYGEKFRSEIYEPGLSDFKYGFGATVNGRLTGQIGGIDKRLKDGDQVILLPIVSGG